MRQSWLWLIGLLLVSVLALSIATPVAQQVPGPDSSIFLYFGKQIDAGQLPYRDLFDHKPPVVFYLDALGLALDGGTRWGVWTLQVVFIFGAAVFGFLFLRRYVKTWIAGLAVIGFLVNLVLVLERGNLTEEYALPFQFAALLLFARLDDQRGFRWCSILFGASFGLAFMLKQSLIGIWLSIGLIFLLQVIWSRKWKRITELFWWGLGAALVILPWIVYFAANGILKQFWEGAFQYNFLYTMVGNGDRLIVLDEALDFITRLSGFFTLAFLAWIAVLIILLVEHEPTRRVFTSRWIGLPLGVIALYFLYKGSAQFGLPLQFTNNQIPWKLLQLIYGTILAAIAFFSLTGMMRQKVYPWLEHFKTGKIPAFLPLFVTAVDVPVEIGTIILGGNNYHHYFMSLLPAFTVLIAVFIWMIASWGNLVENRFMPYVWVALFMLPILQNGLNLIQKQSLPGSDAQIIETTSYIQANTQQDDKVLMWGFNIEPIFLSGRQSPTRYAHMLMLFNPAYGTPARFDAFLKEIQSSPPKLIINTNVIPFIDFQNGQCVYDKSKLIIGVEKVLVYICNHYQKVQVLGKDQWSIYQINTP